MKVLFLFAGVVALALTASVNVHKPKGQQYQSEKYDYSYMQKAILNLLKNVYQPNFYPELAKIGSTYNFEANSQFYTNPKYVSEFFEDYNFGFLPKGQVFSIFYDLHQKEAIAFFRVLYSAVDFDTFYKTAAWGRLHLNEGLYIYALSVALVHRPDTWQLELPPIYEMYPFYFYNAEVLQKARQYFFKGDYTSYFKPAGEQIPFQGKSQSYQKSYPYGQFPYQKSQYPGQYEQYKYQQSDYPKSHSMNYNSYPYKYGQFPYEKSEYPGQYEQYPYQQYPHYHNVSYAKSISVSWNYQSFPSTYEKYPYKQFQYPTEQEQYYSSQYPSQYKAYPYYKAQYPYGKYEQTYPYGKTEFTQEKIPFFYEQSQYPYEKTPFSYEKTQHAFGKTPFSFEKFPTGKSQYPNQYNTQERENVPEYYNKDNFEGITIDYEYNTANPLFYFTEDVGMNAFYYYYHIYFPFWMTSEEIIFKTEFRGEQYYYFYQQLLARYNLERLSNGMGEIPLMDWDGLVDQGFESDLAYPNGDRFPHRPHYSPISPTWEESMQCYDNITFSVTNIKAYEHRILEAIDSGFILTMEAKYISTFDPRGFEFLGNLIQSNPESTHTRYYGNLQALARLVLGYAKYPVDQYYIAPSVLEHFETSLRDPAFYQLYQRVIYYFQRFKHLLPTYTPEELYMSGVKIEDVTFDKLVTYFDYFYTDISSGILGPIESSKLKDTPIRIKQYRLNHQPFNYYLNVKSEKPYEAVIRVFLGPKYDQYGNSYSINNNRLNFVEFDRFTYSLVPGVNTIERNSRQSFFAQDRTSYRELYMQVFNVHSKPMYETTPKQVSWAMPQRMLLPKGSKEGQTFQMYFIITPYMGVPQDMSTKYSQSTPTLFWNNTWDKLPYGYPFDKPIDETYFSVPNSYFKDVVIYNEGFGKY